MAHTIALEIDTLLTYHETARDIYFILCGFSWILQPAWLDVGLQRKDRQKWASTAAWCATVCLAWYVHPRQCSSFYKYGNQWRERQGQGLLKLRVKKMPNEAKYYLAGFATLFKRKVKIWRVTTIRTENINFFFLFTLEIFAFASIVVQNDMYSEI